jgi:phosphopantothenoylcysteine decarboxylase / phosphopantothenate---cysteine ligase
MRTANKNCLIVTGGVGCRKFVRLVERLFGEGYAFDVYITRNAQKIFGYSKETFPYIPNLVLDYDGYPYHILNYERYFVVPCTYNFIGKMAHGIADDMPSTLISFAIGRIERGQAGIVIAPEYHNNMDNAVLKANLKTLLSLGFSMIEPDEYADNKNLRSNDELYAILTSEYTR